MNNFEEEYHRIAEPMQAFQLPLEGLIQVLLESEGIRVHGVASRVKTKTSVERKLQRSDEARNISSLTDILGVRVITYFPDEVDVVANLIEREFTVDRKHSTDKRMALEPDRFGYLSLHYILQLAQSRSALPEYRGFKDIKFELQIRSILQHAWAEIEHDLGYKSEVAVPKAVRREFSRLAGLLELADAEFLRIREELASSSTPSHSFAEKVQFEIERLLTRPKPITLPPWPRKWTEAEYNAYVSHTDPRFVLLDRLLLEIPSSNGRFEACDLLGPSGELIHVQRLRSSSSFGHLFNQALVSAEILVRFPNARIALSDAIRSRGEGRTLSPDFLPRDVVLAFPSGESSNVSVQQIPFFSRVTLARTMQTLETLGVTLHVVGISEQLGYTELDV
jgi:ppGpp synthetase/RelA/SpoT-type nucleotidyltranferase